MPFYPIKYWICYKFSAKNDSISSSNSWTKLPFPRNGVGNLKIHSHISGREFEAWNSRLGKPTPSKTDDFLEKFQAAFDPSPLIFGKLCCNCFPKFMTKVLSIMAKICKINFWIENAPPLPPFGTFQKIHPFWKGSASL